MSHIPCLLPFLSKCVQIRLLFLLVAVGMGEALVLKVLVESGAVDRDEVGGRRTDIELVLVGVVDTNLDVEAISNTTKVTAKVFKHSSCVL